MLKLHLVDLFHTLYNELCNKYSDKSNDGAYALVYGRTSVDR